MPYSYWQNDDKAKSSCNQVSPGLNTKAGKLVHVSLILYQNLEPL